MSAGTLQRIERSLLAAWSILDHFHLRRLIMDGFTRLSNDLDAAIASNEAKDAKIADLEQQLTAAQNKPTTGATEDQLNALADKLEAALGKSSSTGSDTVSGAPGSDTVSGGASQQPPADQAHLSEPVVGGISTTVTDPSTGNTTTLDHASNTATTVDAQGTTIPTDPAAAAAVTQAAQAAGKVSA